jgi:uncharacterized phage protein (TIGR01671 family)
MNRQLKFRVWLPSLNKFGSDNSVFMDCYGKLYGVTRPSLVDDSRSIVNIGQFKEFSGYTIQQYTGLNDNNDDPIYEGDILENHYDVSNNIIGQVLYEADHGGYIFQWKRKVRGQGYKITNLNCDVAFESVIVGNIFEHSELLK